MALWQHLAPVLWPYRCNNVHRHWVRLVDSAVSDCFPSSTSVYSRCPRRPSLIPFSNVSFGTSCAPHIPPSCSALGNVALPFSVVKLECARLDPVGHSAACRLVEKTLYRNLKQSHPKEAPINSGAMRRELLRQSEGCSCGVEGGGNIPRSSCPCEISRRT